MPTDRRALYSTENTVHPYINGKAEVSSTHMHEEIVTFSYTFIVRRA
jgi:hypothetical protein